MKSILFRQDVTNQESLFSLSIADLMSALLLVFILILSGTLLRLAEQEELNKERLEMISEQEMAKRSIIAQLMGEMEQFDVEVDPRTGAIRIKEGILFEYAQSVLTQQGKRFLHKFIPKYVRILLAKSEIREQIGQVIIEGHTDNIGSYQYNLRLSLNRAYSVAAYVFSEEFKSFPYKDIFQKRLSVDGRSFINPIADNTMSEGRSKNRRVEFKFSFIDWTTLQSGTFLP